jgi:hypothetical protein
MNEFSLVVYDTPSQKCIGKIGDAPIYADCGGCGQAAAIIWGAICSSDGPLALVRPPGSLQWRYGYLCHTCLETELLASASFSGGKEK